MKRKEHHIIKMETSLKTDFAGFDILSRVSKEK